MQTLLENNRLPEYLTSKSHTELSSMISEVLKKFEYEIYFADWELMKTNACKVNTFVDASFQLHVNELKDLLLAKDADEESSLMRLFVNSKMTAFVAQHNKLHVKGKQKNERIHSESNPRIGLWNSKKELVYGLWHNTLTDKISRGSLSRLYNRKVLSASLIKDNPRVIIDLNYLSHLDYPNEHLVGYQIRRLFSYNKYQSYWPFTIELCQSDTASLFNDVMKSIEPSWNNPRHFKYEHHSGQTVAQLCPSSDSVYYICPAASQSLAIDEVLNPEHVFVLPAFVSNLSDPVFAQISIEMERLKVNFRRLPVDDKRINIHEGIPLDITFATLHDMRYGFNLDWNTVFRKHAQRKIIRPKNEINLEIYKKRKLSIESAYLRQRTISKNYNQSRLIKDVNKK